MGNKNAKETSFIERYKAVHDYVNSIESLPPTHNITTLANTIPLPDPDFYNKSILDMKFKAVDDARINVINTCGFDPSLKLHGFKKN